MKKTVFDLSYTEGKKIEKELKNTSYGKSLNLLANMVMWVAGLAFVLDLIFSVAYSEEVSTDMYTIIMFFAFFFYVLLRWKWMELIKKYYDEKVKK